MKQITKRLTYANVMSSIAVFLVLGGATALAAGLGKNSVGTKQLKKNAVTGAKVKNGSLGPGDLKAGVIPPKVDAYTKAESNAQFATKAGTYSKTETYSKAESNSRFLGSTVTVVETLAASIPANSFEDDIVNCPAGYQAVGGGVDPDGVFYGKVSSSSPVYGGTRLSSVGDGQTGPATGWYGAVTTEGAGIGTSVVKLAVICAPIG
ncbi:MAG TPA: hypothetical protein VNM38_12630 [Solirubrobacterales bacterium]|nr:hypothetical protein [Solirubrobacterales bacterium]